RIVSPAPDGQWPQPQLPPQHPPPPPPPAMTGRGVAKEDRRRVTVEAPHSGQRTSSASLRTSSSNVPEQSAHRYSDRKSTRLNSSHGYISYAVFCLKKKKK